MNGFMRGKGYERSSVIPRVDDYTEALVVMLNEHEMIHRGQHFTLANYFSGVGSGSSVYIWLETEADYEIHADFFVHATAGVLMSAYHTPSFTYNASNAITPYPNNIHHTGEDGIVKACHTPSGSGAGTAITPVYPYGAGGNPASSDSGSGRASHEQILTPGGTYLLKCESLAASNKITTGISYYVVRD